LRGDTDIDSVISRFDLAEEVKALSGVQVLVSAPATAMDEVATGLVSARSDYVVIED
jgi:hypothetical protein